jgi:hypothetical protein
MAVELNDTQRFPRRDIQDDDLLMVFGGSGGPGAVPAAGLGGGASALQVYFPGPHANFVSGSLRSTSPQTMNIVFIWLTQPNYSDLVFTLERDGVVLDTFTMPAGAVTGTFTPTVPVFADFDTPLIVRMVLTGISTGRDAMFILTKE